MIRFEFFYHFKNRDELQLSFKHASKYSDLNFGSKIILVRHFKNINGFQRAIYIFRLKIWIKISYQNCYIVIFKIFKIIISDKFYL